MKLYIKNMVCDRCKRAVQQVLTDAGLDVQQVQLGEVIVSEWPAEVSTEQVASGLQANGFELLDDRKTVLVEQIKSIIINEVHHNRRDRPEQQNLSDFLAQKIGYDYSYLSHLFSAVEGISIERYAILQKIEKVKEYLFYGELSLSEIAWRVGYSSSQHLSNQFRQVVGMTPGEFRKVRQPLRTELDKVQESK
ncbi:hypothetical protein GCM10023189_24980 [Nibrella saemangeumensis]|uniref:HTH araC/xylS-type domain-containing protein n=1 Tax=Nibrella saemangeumensis TaxID=1084526 RepID=A0ABP8MXY6_9BACT